MFFCCVILFFVLFGCQFYTLRFFALFCFYVKYYFVVCVIFCFVLLFILFNFALFCFVWMSEFYTLRCFVYDCLYFDLQTKQTLQSNCLHGRWNIFWEVIFLYFLSFFFSCLWDGLCKSGTAYPSLPYIVCSGENKKQDPLSLHALCDNSTLVSPFVSFQQTITSQIQMCDIIPAGFFQHYHTVI